MSDLIEEPNQPVNPLATVHVPQTSPVAATTAALVAAAAAAPCNDKAV